MSFTIVQEDKETSTPTRVIKPSVYYDKWIRIFMNIRELQNKTKEKTFILTDQNDADSLKILLDAKADVSLKDSRGRTALCRAAYGKS